MSKSRSGKTPNSSQNAPPVTTQNAIIPGKFFESDWNELLEIEDDENFISDIIDEISDAACNQVFNNIVESRVQPHSVLAARELLLDIIEWNFLQNDPGESNTNEKLSWIEDDEPSECVIDNWAQGAVPKKDIVQHEEVIKFSEKVETPLTTNLLTSSTGEENVNFLNYIIDDKNIDEESITTIEDSLIEEGRDSLDSSVNNDIKVYVDKGQQFKVKKKSKKYRPHVGSLPTFEKIPLESITDLRPKPGTRPPLSAYESSVELLVKNQYGRTSGPKEVVYDEKGQVVKVEKLNVANFPKHRVPVKYSIIDTEKETHKMHNKLKKDKNQTAEKSIRNRNKISAKSLLQRVHPSATWAPSITDYNNVNANSSFILEPRSPLPPLMVDSMNVTDGVTIREGGLSKQVIKKTTRETSVEKRPIHPIANSNNRVLEVKDIVSESSPTFRYVGAPETLAGI